MSTRSVVQTAARVGAAGAALSVAAYAVLASGAWRHYGNPSAPETDERDSWLDRFMPRYDVVERHRIAVKAPPDVVFTAAQEQNLMGLLPVRAIFKARELALRATPGDDVPSMGLLDTVKRLGWGVLAEEPGREVVVGAVTKPWEANVTFTALPASEFAAYAEPDHVKIIWTLRADPDGERGSIFRTETRAVATDPIARAKFRRYWAFASPGIAAIRWLTLRPLKQDAERRFTRASRA